MNLGLAVIMETNGSGSRYGVSDELLTAVMRENGFAPFGYDPFARRLVAAAANSAKVNRGQIPIIKLAQLESDSNFFRPKCWSEYHAPA